ncbi:hypothetical protein [Actinocrispum wychmicini]|uniref:Uncharacterized protein n=1 Tax=Actinocrispum wychmicini TaxID=1213861 RepID=A0A4R2JDV2_9PSEU|nr:hypothetical protein [Actinocrispum wychmicini]TCO57124.1 hypothetical protein EV192_106601 [Actinocrispum wychmicini]
MSRSFVRQAAYGYLSTPAITNVDYVFPGIPFDQAGVPWDQLVPAGQTHRCFLVIEIGESRDFGDHIFVLDGAGGRRVVPYPVVVSVYFEDVGGDPLTALTTQEAILDAVADRMRSDPSLGQPASTGLLVAAAPLLNIVPGPLERQGGGDTLYAWSTVDFDVSIYEFQT